MSATPDKHVAVAALQMALASPQPAPGPIPPAIRGARLQWRLSAGASPTGPRRQHKLQGQQLRQRGGGELLQYDPERVGPRPELSSRDEARAEVFEFIEVVSNRQRLRQSLGYVRPVQFETHHAVP